VVDYSRERARKQNPLYVDAGAYTRITPEEYDKVKEINRKMKTALKFVMTEMFGSAVVQKIMRDAGIEFGSKPHYASTAKRHRVTVAVVWKHDPQDKPKKEEMVVII